MLERSGSTSKDFTDLAYTDPLTGLGNHRRFVDKVERLKAERAEDPAPFAIGIIDLDGFKPINDLFGRSAGDDILMQVAMRLRAAMGRALDRDAHRRRRVRLPAAAGFLRGRGVGKGQDPHRDIVGPL